MYNIFFTEEAKSVVDRLSAKKKRQIKNAVERIANRPYIGKRLTQELTGMWLYRSGDFRIIYRIEHKQLFIIILTIGHRKDIYNRISRKQI
jgi:mRNA interferase RelE/StbE